MKILLTGGSGYLGSILTRKLLKKGFRVRILDNFLFGKHPLTDVIKNKDLELIDGDVRDLAAVSKSLKDVDVVIHLASIVGTQSSELDPKTSIEINYLATRNIADLCKLYKIKQFVFASTCSVYGAQPNNFISENSEVNPLDSYGQSKFQSERAILQAYDYPTILRLGTLFGASYRMRFDLAINLFLAQALNKEDITVFGGNQWRPFLHVDDAAEAFSFVVENNMEGIYNTIWKNITIEQMAREVKKLIPTGIKISKDIVDKRDYRVTGAKLEKFGYKATKDIKYAANEFKTKISEDVKNYKQEKYSNYKSFFNSTDIQRKVYTQGPIFKK
ncbi:MAG: SDR family oxidoreductase [Thaumarchaeota archaeon]|nr:SDR family oxidoreductase [Nitrososphaerota archaeon]